MKISYFTGRPTFELGDTVYSWNISFTSREFNSFSLIKTELLTETQVLRTNDNEGVFFSSAKQALAMMESINPNAFKITRS